MQPSANPGATVHWRLRAQGERQTAVATTCGSAGLHVPLVRRGQFRPGIFDLHVENFYSAAANPSPCEARRTKIMSTAPHIELCAGS